MGLVAELAKVINIQVITKGSLDLVAMKDVNALLDEAMSRRLLVVGIEGFHIRDEQVMPDMNAIADFSANIHSDNPVNASIHQSLRFVREVGDAEMYFDFVFMRE
ncbi:MAG: hypothetical protein ABUS47_01350 [Steroidobacter sp.]